MIDGNIGIFGNCDLKSAKLFFLEKISDEDFLNEILLYFPEAKLYAGWNRYKTKNYLGIFWILGAGELNTEYAMQWGQIAGFFWVPFFRKSQKGFVFNNVKIHFLWWINFTKEHELKIINKDNKRRFTHKPMYLTNTNN